MMVTHSPFRLRYCLCVSILLFTISGYSRAAEKSQPTANPQNSIGLYPPESRWVLADLEGDQEPDFAESRRLDRTRDGYSYQVQLLLSSDGPSSSLREPTGEKAQRRLPENLTGQRYIRPLPIKSFVSNQHPIEWIFDHAVDAFHQRSPPTG